MAASKPPPQSEELPGVGDYIDDLAQALSQLDDEPAESEDA